jgi:hypothetical protein
MVTMIVIPFTFADVKATDTDNVLDTNDNDREIQASHGATAIAADRSPYINDAEPSVPKTSDERRGTTPLEAAEQQGTNQTLPNSLAECSERTSASTTTSALSSPSFQKMPQLAWA